MKFSIGDKVIFRHTDEEGVVVGYINADMVEVDVAGVTFPVHTDEIDHPYLKWFTQKKVQPARKIIPEQLPVEKEKLRKPRLSRGIYLSFMPEYKIEEMEDVVDLLKIYLLNETPKTIRYKYDFEVKNGQDFSHEGKLHEFGNVFLHSIPYDSMNDLPRFNWTLDDLDDGDMAPAGGQLRIKPQKLFQHINELLANNQPSFNYLLIEDFQPVRKQEMPKPVKPKTVATTQPRTKNISSTPSAEIDLHIENLVENTRSMSNTDILMTQLSALQTQLRIAINARQERLIIIHGLGKGKLREEVHKLLAETPEVKTYTNEWMARYGFGATEVWFQY